MQRYKECRARLKIAISVENILYLYISQFSEKSGKGSEKARDLALIINESLKGIIEAACWAIESGDIMDFSMLEGLTLSHQERFNEIRARYGDDSLQKQDLALKTALQATHRIERITYLLGDYVLLRLSKKETGAGSSSNRKMQQNNLLS